MTEQQLTAMKLALEALEYAQTGNRRPEVIGTAITALRTAIEQAETAQGQEPVAWQVHPFDYGIGHEGVYARTDRPEQVEMWKRKGWTVQPLYTIPPAQEFVCSTGLCHFTLTQTNVGIGERGMEAYEAAKKRGWVGLSDERLMEMPKQGCQCPACKTTPHASDCAVHNEPAYPNGECNCGVLPPKRERVVFPTMIRKMWSGGEVQAWLDENVNKGEA